MARWLRDQWLDAIFHDPAITPPERALAFVIARYAGEGRTAYASHKTLRFHTGIRTDHGVEGARDRMIERGYLTVVKHGRGRQADTFAMIHPDADSTALSAAQRSTDSTAPGAVQGESLYCTDGPVALHSPPRSTALSADNPKEKAKEQATRAHTRETLDDAPPADHWAGSLADQRNGTEQPHTPARLAYIVERAGVRTAVRATAGGREIDDDHAWRVAKRCLDEIHDRSGAPWPPDNPTGAVVTWIRRDRDPARFLPTGGQPPPHRRDDGGADDDH